MPPLGGFPSEYRHPVWYRKIRMVWLSNGVKIWHDTRTWQRDGQTDTAWRHRPRLGLASRGKNRRFPKTATRELQFSNPKNVHEGKRPLPPPVIRRLATGLTTVRHEHRAASLWQQSYLYWICEHAVRVVRDVCGGKWEKREVLLRLLLLLLSTIQLRC